MKLPENNVEGIEDYNLIEYIEYFDEKMNFKKTKSRQIQNDENLLELIKTWNQIKLESKMQNIKTSLILRRKLANPQINEVCSCGTVLLNLKFDFLRI